MNVEPPTLNQVGMPPPGRSIHKRRAQLEAESAEHGETPAISGNELLVSIITCGGVLAVGLALAWLVL